MKAAVVRSPGDIRWQDVPDPSLPTRWARVEVKAVGVCSSDVPRALHGTAYAYPLVLGHEIAGLVREVGSEGDRRLLGKRVAVAPLIPCGRCEWCGRGRYSLCDDYDYLGSRRDGGCAEAVLAPASNLVPLPDDISFDSGALMEPAAVALHAILGKVQEGDRVVVVGVGPIGQFVIQLAQLLGAQRIAAVDVLAKRLELAERWGAQPVFGRRGQEVEPGIRAALGGGGADLVVIATAAPAAQVASLELADKGARVVHLGLPHGEVTLPPGVFERIVRYELELSGSWNSYSSPFPGVEWELIGEYMAAGRLLTEPLISRRLPMEEAAAAYRLLAENKDRLIKVLLTG